MANSSTSPKPMGVSRYILYGLWLGVAIGLFADILLGMQMGNVNKKSPFYEFARVLLLSGACLTAGGLIGFLFGIPRMVQRDKQGQDNDLFLTSDPNTNLEQISDWLTKIIVGLGLVHITQMPAGIASWNKYVAKDFSPLSESTVGAIGIYFSLFGFFIAYLIARLFLQAAFDEASRRARELKERARNEELARLTSDVGK